MNQQVVTIKGPADMAAVIPTLLGFTPTDSVVVLFMFGERRRVGMTARWDIAMPIDAGTIARSVRSARSAYPDTNTAVVFGYGADFDLLDEVRRLLDEAGVETLEPHQVSGLTVRCSCCEPQLINTAMPLPAEPPHATRQDIVDSFAFDESAAPLDPDAVADFNLVEAAVESDQPATYAQLGALAAIVDTCGVTPVLVLLETTNARAFAAMLDRLVQLTRPGTERRRNFALLAAVAHWLVGHGAQANILLDLAYEWAQDGLVRILMALIQTPPQGWAELRTDIMAVLR